MPDPRGAWLLPSERIVQRPAELDQLLADLEPTGDRRLRRSINAVTRWATTAAVEEMPDRG
jgi:hypothetical protein